MSDKSITRKSKKFYEQFHFPGTRPVDRDGLIFLRRFSQSIKNLGGDGNTKLRVLDAGCGTGNTTISLSRQFRDVEFFGIDNSKSSLEIAKLASGTNKLTNVYFRKWNLLKPLPFKQKFDIILCLGVLHHTADMERVLLNLNFSLKTNRQLYLWIYGRHGRYNHTLNVRLLDMLLNADSKQSYNMKLAKEFIFRSQNFSPVDDLINKTKTGPMQKMIFESPVWIADQFLNPHENLIDMEKLIELTDSAGFEIENVLGMNEDFSAYYNSPLILKQFNKLDKKKRLIALDLIQKPERYFVCLRKAVNKRRNR